MLMIQKKYIIDESGDPQEVIISFEDFQLIEELLGLDLEDEIVTHLHAARDDRENGRPDTYVDLNSIK